MMIRARIAWCCGVEALLCLPQKCVFVIIGRDKGYANGRGEEIEEYLLALSPPS